MLTLQSNHAAAHVKCTPEPEIMGAASNDSNYIIVNQEDIRKKLNLLSSSNVLLTIKVPGKFVISTLLTTITSIEGGYVFFGGFQNERFNRDLLMQNTLIVMANFEGISVSFILSHLSGHYIDGTFSLKALLPQSMEWVQRRNARRVKIPINIPVKMQYQNTGEYFSVADISVAGLSYLDSGINHRCAVTGEVHSSCNIILPDNSAYQASIEIVNNITIPYQRTKKINRIGCEIKRASYRLDTALQHLINQIDFYYR